MSDNIFLYALSTCSHCKRTKKFLDENDVSYDYCFVDKAEGEERTALIDKVKKHNPKCTFPTLVVGDAVIIGHKEEEIKKALGL